MANVAFNPPTVIRLIGQTLAASGQRAPNGTNGPRGEDLYGLQNRGLPAVVRPHEQIDAPEIAHLEVIEPSKTVNLYASYHRAWPSPSAVASHTSRQTTTPLPNPHPEAILRSSRQPPCLHGRCFSPHLLGHPSMAWASFPPLRRAKCKSAGCWEPAAWCHSPSSPSARSLAIPALLG